MPGPDLRGILLVGPVAPPEGGMAVQGQLLLARLAASGHRVEFLATNPRLGTSARVPILRTLVSGLVFVFHLVPAVRRCRVVHVLAASGFYFLARVAPAVLLGRLFRRRVVVNYRGGLAGPFLDLHRWWAGFVLRRAHVLTVPSAYLERIFGERGFAPVRVPNIADLERFAGAARSGLRPRFLVNRTLEPLYDVGTAIRAFEQIQAALPGAVLSVAGTGPEEAGLRAMAAGRPGVRFLGRVAHADMPGVYADHDVLLNPTTADNMPISLLEAMAAGLVVVSTDAGGIPDLVASGRDALLVPVHAPDALAAAALRLFREPGLADSLREKARATAAEYGWDQVRHRLFAAYGLAAAP
jgi:glycosyltransferase involved in cell wall biosynthesis